MITIYGTTGCPMCSYVKQKLTPLGVDFQYVTDEDVMAAKGISHVPVVELADGTMLHGKDIMDFVSEQEAKSRG